jgi:hypothetical protein
MLGERIYGLKRLISPGTLPIRLKLLSVQLGPFLHEQERPPRKRTGDQHAVQVDGCGLTRIPRVEMWARVPALIPVHIDRDSVEEADPRHAATVRPPAAAARPIAMTPGFELSAFRG